MKKDWLEKYITENKNQLDEPFAAPELWSKINRALDEAQNSQVHNQQLRKWKIFSIAASFALIIAAGGWFVSSQYSHSQQEQWVNKVPDDQRSQFVETKNYYASQVNQKLGQIEKLDPNSNVAKDIDQLDAVFKELQYELLTSSEQNREEILNAMILNYQTKIEILEKVLGRINEQKQNQKENENIDI